MEWDSLLTSFHFNPRRTQTGSELVLPLPSDIPFVRTERRSNWSRHTHPPVAMCSPASFPAELWENLRAMRRAAWREVDPEAPSAHPPCHSRSNRMASMGSRPVLL